MNQEPNWGWAMSSGAKAGDRRVKEAEALLSSLKEMRDACAICFQIIFYHDLSVELDAKLSQTGIQPGFGVRAREAIEAYEKIKAQNA